MRVLGVHGIGNLQPNLDAGEAAQRLATYWSSALVRGLPSAAEFEVAMAYYAPLLSAHDAQGGNAADAADPRVLDAVDPDDFASWGRALGAPDEVAQGRLTVPVRALLDWVADRHGLDQALTRRFVTRFFAEVHRYLTDESTASAVRKVLVGSLEAHQPRVLVAHSLGSVVAYEALWQEPAVQVDLLLTLGSPLAMPGVVLDRLRGDETRGRPPCVKRWVNVADRGDIVAVPVGGLSDTFVGVRDIAEAVGVFDFHRVTRYLACGATAGALAATAD